MAFGATLPLQQPLQQPHTCSKSQCKLTVLPQSLGLQAYKVLPWRSRLPWTTLNFIPAGSSILKALLADGTFTPRAVTRNPNSEKALKLKELGAEVVQADLRDVPSLKNAMNGVEVVFGVNFSPLYIRRVCRDPSHPPI
jgi:hypothetical protein